MHWQDSNLRLTSCGARRFTANLQCNSSSICPVRGRCLFGWWLPRVISLRINCIQFLTNPSTQLHASRLGFFNPARLLLLGYSDVEVRAFRLFSVLRVWFSHF